MDIEQVVQEKMDADAVFQETLESLPEEEREQAVADKRREVLSQEFALLKEKADEAEKAKELAENYKIRAEKAEKSPKAEKSDLSSSDLYALMNAKVPEEDISEVSDYAKLKKVSIAEALKASVVKTILAERAEERATATATATGAQRRTTSKVSDETVLENASKGQVPDDDDGIDRLTEARLNAKIKS